MTIDYLYEVVIADDEYDPGVIITLGPPADIHGILGLPAVRLLRIPPGITPPSVPLQQGKTSSMSQSGGGFSVMQCLMGIAYSGSTLCI